MLIDSIGYLKRSNSSADADIKKAQVRPYVNLYLSDFSGLSFAKNLDSRAANNCSNSMLGRFLNLFA